MKHRIQTTEKEKMSNNVTIKFRKTSDRTADNIKKIIFNIPGRLKAGHTINAMGSMILGDSYVLNFAKTSDAVSTAKALVEYCSDIIDIKLEKE